MLRIDVTCPTPIRTGYDVPPDNPFVGRAGVRAARSGRSACAIRGGTASTIRRAAAPARWSSATSARTRGRKSTTSRPARGGRNYGWRNREGAHDNVTTLPRRSLSRSSIRSSNTPQPSASSITGGFVYRGSALGAAYVGRYFFADFVTSRVWSIALTIEPGDARGHAPVRLARAHGGARRQRDPRQRALRRRRRRRALHRQLQRVHPQDRRRSKHTAADTTTATAHAAVAVLTPVDWSNGWHGETKNEVAGKKTEHVRFIWKVSNDTATTWAGVFWRCPVRSCSSVRA